MPPYCFTKKLKFAENVRATVSGHLKDCSVLKPSLVCSDFTAVVLTVAELTLMDANYTVDEVLSTRQLSLNPLPLHGKQKMTIKFNDVRPLDNRERERERKREGGGERGRERQGRERGRERGERERQRERVWEREGRER